MGSPKRNADIQRQRLGEMKAITPEDVKTVFPLTFFAFRHLITVCS